MRILIVEDDQKIANSIKKGLEQEAYAVDVSYDGEDGFDLAVTEEYDVIILDWMLPKKNGINFCKELRQENVHVPVLMLTAKGQIKDRVDGLDVGADDYLVKPFAFDEFLARVRALLRRPKKYIASTLVCGDLTLDTVNFEVNIKNKPVHLSKKEYALLEYLLRNKNKVVTKEQIINHAWNYESDVLPNTVEAYIRYLRQKIDQPFQKDFIKTVRGFGYKVVDSD
jgi:DNA-binding response OmpR family regulator